MSRIDEIREFRAAALDQPRFKFSGETYTVMLEYITILLAEVARLDEANKIKFDLIMTVHAPKIANLEAKLAKRDEMLAECELKLQRAIDYFNDMGNWGDFVLNLEETLSKLKSMRESE